MLLRCTPQVWSLVLKLDDGAGTATASATAPTAATAATVLNADSDFFDLGGHSLLLVKVAAGLRAGTGLEVGAR